MKATALHRQVGSDVAVTSITRRPRAIVIVLGEKLDHNTELYHSLNCSTISVETTRQPQHVVGEWAATVTRETARLVRIAELSEMGMGSVPVMIHVIGKSARSFLEKLEGLADFVGHDGGLPSLPARAAATKTFNMNASTRSLFTTETDPMSSDDEDDESSHEEIAVIVRPPLTPSRGMMLQRHSPQQQISRRRLSDSVPHVHRIDMERTAVSLHHTSNPEERACRRDLEAFSSRLVTVLWDMPPPNNSWFMSHVVAPMITFFLLLWNFVRRLFFRGSLSTATPEPLAGMSLAQEHALMYVDGSDEHVQQLQQETRLIMECQLQGTRKQHGAAYVAFVQQVVDRISHSYTQEDDGWSSDEE